jgi:hypothetical protein
MGKLGYGASFFEATEGHYSGWFRRMGPANRTGMYTLAWRICEDGGGTGRCGARWDMVNVHGNKAGILYSCIWAPKLRGWLQGCMCRDLVSEDGVKVNSLLELQTGLMPVGTLR